MPTHIIQWVGGTCPCSQYWQLGLLGNGTTLGIQWVFWGPASYNESEAHAPALSTDNKAATSTWNMTMIGMYMREAIMLTDDRERRLKNQGYAPWHETYRHTGTQTERGYWHNNPQRRMWDMRELALCNSIINPWKTCVNSENAKQRELVSTTTGTEMQGKTNWAPTTPEEFSKFSETCETDGNEFSLFCIQND